MMENNKSNEIQLDKITVVSTTDENFIEFRKMHLLYLQKLEKLTDKERTCFTDYFNLVNKPTIV